VSVLVQAFYDAEYLFTVNEDVFDPPPKVKSGVLRLRRKAEQKLNCDPKKFKQVVKAAFNQRRKTLRNSLKPFGIADKVDASILGERPEQLSWETFVDITNAISD
jgi:16S rRNA (adenine1518-N6/adenine1519-N6)-dimethyltransferase